MDEFSLTLRGPEETAQLGRGIASLCEKGDCIALKGDLGGGKTTFARGLIQAICGRDTEVTSPTFTLVQHYENEKISLTHADLYRLESPGELEELGLEEALEEGVLLVEWPEIAMDLLPKSLLTLHFQQKTAENERLLVGKAPSEWYIRLTNSGIIQ